jgi:uncharacterized membrane protein
MLRFFSRHMLTGLITVLPVLITLYVIYWFVMSMESALGSVIRSLLPELDYWPGMGVAAALVVVFVIGLLMHVYVVQKLFSRAESLLYHTPIIKTVYGAFRDFFHYFSSSREQEFQQVVKVQLENGTQLIGFMTQAKASQLPASIQANEDQVLVYLPMSYMIGGYALLLPRSRVETIDMSMEEAMRFTLTAGLASSKRD